MGTLGERLLRLWRGLRAAMGRTPRRALAAGAGALVVVVVCVSLLVAQLRPAAPAYVTRPVARALPTSTATATRAPTATPVPTQVPIAKPVPTTPPPPPVPSPPPATPTPTPCPTAIPTLPATPTATASATPAVTAGATAATGTVPADGAPSLPLAGQVATACEQCPIYTGNNPSQSELRAALDAAADAYHLPRHLVEAVAWQESKWHEDVTSCDGGLGLMQIQYYNVDWLNGVVVAECGLGQTSYDVHSAAGNASLGAKYLAYLSCFYSYWGGYSGHTLSTPAAYTVAWYYQQAGLPYPDTTRSDGTPSLCAAVFSDPAHPEYPDLPSTTAQPWSCPYSATAGDTTLLDITLSAYNEGPGYTGECGICNPSYVASVEGFIPQFFSGSLPTGS